MAGLPPVAVTFGHNQTAGVVMMRLVWIWTSWVTPLYDQSRCLKA